MLIKNFKKGNTVHHKTYGEGVVKDVFLDDKDNKNNGVLVSLNTKKGIDQLNEDRLIKGYPKNKDILKRVFSSESELFFLN